MVRGRRFSGVIFYVGMFPSERFAGAEEQTRQFYPSSVHRPCGIGSLLRAGPSLNKLCAARPQGRLTGLAYTLGHEDMRARVASLTAESYAIGERWLREVVKKEDLSMPAGQLVRVFDALTEGLVLQRLLTPELVPDQVIRAAFLALATRR